MDKNNDVKKKSWEKPELEMLGKIADIVQAGTGKLSVTGGDPGEMRKEVGTEME